MTLRIYNTLTRTKEVFTPIDPTNVRMYVCGPTVYDFAHIGNARPAIVFDVLYRLLRHLYGADHVTYVRNITDVDDKINARALRDFKKEIDNGEMSLNEAIRKVTETTANQYQTDVEALGCLKPTKQPRATDYIDGMVKMIQVLLDRGIAYVAQGEQGREALFDVKAMPDYGKLSRRNLEDQKSGARVAVEKHKRNPGDFVLWKESSDNEPGWNATFKLSAENQNELRLNPDLLSIRGRPGWHIECSVMSKAHLGEVFDIHGGGLDLIFPHHENEIAQSRCANGTHGTDLMAKYWMHNGFLQVEGQKMSKSLGNFFSIAQLREEELFGGRKWRGEVLRLAMMMTHYRQPIDWSVKTLELAERKLNDWYKVLPDGAVPVDQAPDEIVVAALTDDLNTHMALSNLDSLFKTDIPIGGGFASGQNSFYVNLGWSTARFLGLMNCSKDEWFANQKSESKVNFELIESFLQARLEARKAKDWKKSDEIRDQLAAMGIQIKDVKDPATGELKTEWEVKR